MKLIPPQRTSSHSDKAFRKPHAWLLMAVVVMSLALALTFSGKAHAATSATASAGCQVTYTNNAQWPGSFTATLTIVNTGSTAINGWTLQFAFPNGQVIQSFFNGGVTQSGANVTVVNRFYNGTIPAGGSVNPTVGFTASWKNVNNPPSAFTLNGTLCSIG